MPQGKVDNIKIEATNLANAIHTMKLLPEEIHKASRWAQLQAGKAARSLSKVSFRERTQIATVSAAKRRTHGSKARAWLGGNPIAIRKIKGRVRIKGGKLSSFIDDSGQRIAVSQTSRVAKAGRKRVNRKNVGKVQQQTNKEYFLLPIPAKPVYQRVGKKRNDVVPVLANIQDQTRQAAIDVTPEVKQILQQKFMERAERIISEGASSRKLSSYKGSTQDRLSALKYFRTTLR